VLLAGEMGAGKTTFVRGAARALGFDGPVTSPTFTIGRRYDGARAPIAHLDLHRLSGLDDEDPALLEDYLTPDAIAFVEWPEIAEPALDRVAVRVTLEHAGGDSRAITILRRPPS
jgi:tRNA threonylcarbamoyladenosine biosynthesis protein TsaE